MAVEIIFPRVDMDMTSGRVSRWLIEEGGPVSKGDPLFEIETDKAAMEIDAPASGTLRGVRAASGEEVAVGTALAWIVAEGEAWQPDEDTSCVRATPLARREAARRGIDLASLHGSGPRGRIVLEDVPAPPAPPEIVSTEAPRPEAARPEATRPLAGGSGGIYRQWLGRGQGTPILFLHGFGSEQSGWRPVWTDLEGRHRILAIDLPGHGRSPDALVARFEALVDAVQGVLDEEGVQAVHLVGHSLGGAVALGLADASAVAIRSLSLIAPAGLGAEIDGAFLRGFLAATREESLAPWMRRLFADPALATPALVRATLRGRSDPQRRATQEAIAEALFPDATQTVSLDAVLARLAMPVQLIWGVADAIIPVRHADRLPGQVGLHRLPCGHMPHLEEPRLVSLLLERLARSAAD